MGGDCYLETRYCYSVCGLSIGSALELPHLIPIKVGDDVRIEFGNVPDLLPGAKQIETRAQVTRDQALLTCGDLGRVLVRYGHEIIIDPSSNIEDPQFRNFLLGSPLGMILHQRGTLTLHANLLAYNGNAVAFMGRSGMGKSTITAALQKLGYVVVSDDICAITLASPSRAVVFPCYPRLKLNEDSLKALGERADSLTPIHDKYLVQTRSFTTSPLTLVQIYFLTVGDEAKLERLNGHNRLLTLINNGYRKLCLSAMGIDHEHFNRCAALAHSVPVCRLTRPPQLSRLTETINLLEKDLASAFN
jgi:hypothetical protein